MNKTKTSLLVSCLFASQLSFAESLDIDAPEVNVTSKKTS